MSTAEASTHARGDFHDRLHRINAGQTLCDDDGLIPPEVARRYARKRPSRWREIMGNTLYPLSIIFAFILGMIAVLVGRLARYHIGGADNPDLDVDILLAMDVGMAAMVAFALRMMFSLESKVHMSAKTMGIMATVATMHNAVHIYPEMTAIIFSEEYVKHTLEYTNPNTVIFRGMEFVL